MLPKILADKLSPLGPNLPLAKADVPSLSAVVAGVDNSVVEKDGLASIRMSMKGSRVVAVARLSHLRGSFPDLQATSVSQFCSFLLQAKPEQVRTMLPGVYRGTTGAGDLLYVPAGCTVSESVPAGVAADAMT